MSKRLAETLWFSGINVAAGLSVLCPNKIMGILANFEKQYLSATFTE
jgi:hypothetical protein